MVKRIKLNECTDCFCLFSDAYSDMHDWKIKRFLASLAYKRSWMVAVTWLLSCLKCQCADLLYPVNEKLS